jgi:hypothetical protein
VFQDLKDQLEPMAQLAQPGLLELLVLLVTQVRKD